jgi:hypothetical protein
VSYDDQRTFFDRWEGFLVLIDALEGSFADLAQKRGAAAVGASSTRESAAMGADAAPPLPCLNRNNSIENTLTGAQKRTAFSLTENVKMMAEKHGIERLLFNTLTFRDHVIDIKEAQRRFNSLRTNVLKHRYLDFITVVERQKSGRIHFHLLAAGKHDFRTGFDFDAAKVGDYRSACAALRSEWAFWRKTSKEYGFGRTEQLPVYSTIEGIACYVGKYIAKHIEQRREDDKGARLVRYSDGARHCSTRFSWNGPMSKLWRKKLRSFAVRHGLYSMDMIRERFGPNWCWILSQHIIEEVVL